MKKINIQISKAKIISYIIELKEDIPEITATIGLFTEQGKQISTFSLSTYDWNEVSFNLPPEMVPLIQEIAKKLENILVSSCVVKHLQLTK